jgi:DNA-binding beta-propeller fold protein YncE
MGAVWALTRTGSRSDSIYLPDPKKPATVVAIDPATNRIVGAPVPVGISPAHMTVGAGAVWVAQYDSGLVTRVELH